MKKLVYSMLIVAVLAIGAFFWLYSSLDSLVKKGIETLGPQITQVSVNVDQVKLSPTDGAGIISGLVIGNPQGFVSAHAISVGAIEVAVEPASLAQDVILIHKIAIISPDIHYESGDNGSNFDIIQRNVNQAIGETQSTKESGKKLIVENLTIRDAKAHYALMGKEIDMPLPDITLRNIGKEKGGATSGELTKAVMDSLTSQLSKSASKIAKEAAKAVGETAKNLGDSVKSLFK